MYKLEQMPMLEELGLVRKLVVEKARWPDFKAKLSNGNLVTIHIEGKPSELAELIAYEGTTQDASPIVFYRTTDGRVDIARPL